MKSISGAVKCPAAWVSRDLLADASWSGSWSAAEVREMDALVSAFRAGEGKWNDVQELDLSAPLLERRLDALAQGLETGRGLFLVRGAPTPSWSEDEAKAIALWMGWRLGVPRGQNRDGALISVVRDVGADYAKDPEARGYMSNAELQPHTDGCDITGLLCLKSARSGGATQLCSSLAILNRILDTDPDLLDPLVSGYPFYLRDADGKGGRLLPNPVPIYFSEGETVSAFLNTKSIEVALDRSGSELEPLSRRALERVRALATDREFCVGLRLQPGDLLLFSNWTTFHSRSEFIDHDAAAEKRCLLRLWVHSKYERSLPTWMAEAARGGLGRPSTGN